MEDYREILDEYHSEKGRVSIEFPGEKREMPISIVKREEIGLDIIILHIYIWVMKLLHYIWVKMRQRYIWVMLAVALAITGVGSLVFLRGGDSETVPYDHSTILDETTTTYLNPSTVEAPEVTQPPTTDHPRPTYADSESPEPPMEGVRRQNQSLEYPECRLEWREEQLASLLKATDELLDKDFYPKKVMVGTCNMHPCRDGEEKCYPYRNSTVNETVNVFYEEKGKSLYVNRIIQSESGCECRYCPQRN